MIIHIEAGGPISEQLKSRPSSMSGPSPARPWHYSFVCAHPPTHLETPCKVRGRPHTRFLLVGVLNPQSRRVYTHGRVTCCCRREMEATAEQGTMKKLRILTTSPMRTSCSSLNNYSTIHPNPYSSYYKDCLAFRDDSVDFVSGRVSESIASLGKLPLLALGCHHAEVLKKVVHDLHTNRRCVCVCVFACLCSLSCLAMRTWTCCRWASRPRSCGWRKDRLDQEGFMCGRTALQ